MNWLARLLARAPEAELASPAHDAVDEAAGASVEELSAELRQARTKARAARQRGRVLQRDGRMGEALRAFKKAGAHQADADRLEIERALIRRAG